MKKVLKVLKKVLNVVVVVFVLLFVLMVCLQRFSDNKLSFFNFRMFTVATGSMEPKYNVGDVLIAKKIDPEDVKKGDAISYLGKEGEFKDKVVTHEVIDIENVDGKYKFHTKGIANIVEDPIVYEDQLYGKIIMKCGLLSAIYKVVGTTTGMFIFVILPLLYLIGSEVITMMLEREDERRSKLKK